MPMGLFRKSRKPIKVQPTQTEGDAVVRLKPAPVTEEPVTVLSRKDVPNIDSDHIEGDFEPPAHLLLGISLEFLVWFTKQHGLEKAMTYEVANMIRNLTAGKGHISLVEAYAEEKVEGLMNQHIGKATLFVSHSQARPIAKMIEALDFFIKVYHDDDEVFLWIDCFSIRQNTIAAEVQHIGALVVSIGEMVLCIDPWHSPLCLTRVWCLYEINMSLRFGVPLNLTMPNDEREDFVRAFEEDEMAVIKTLTAFDSRTAESTMAADRAAIMKCIDEGPGGLDAFNSDTISVLLTALNAYKWIAKCERVTSTDEASTDPEATAAAGGAQAVQQQGRRNVIRSRYRRKSRDSPYKGRRLEISAEEIAAAALTVADSCRSSKRPASAKQPNPFDDESPLFDEGGGFADAATAVRPPNGANNPFGGGAAIAPNDLFAGLAARGLTAGVVSQRRFSIN